VGGWNEIPGKRGGKIKEQNGGRGGGRREAGKEKINQRLRPGGKFKTKKKGEAEVGE